MEYDRANVMPWHVSREDVHCPNNVFMSKEAQVKSDECSDAEVEKSKLYAKYGIIWDTWLFAGEVDYNRAHIYQLCKELDDKGFDENKADELLRRLNGVTGGWTDGIRDFIESQKCDTELKKSTIEMFDIDVIGAAILSVELEFRHGAFRGICDVGEDVPELSRMGEISACFIHTGLKALRVEEVQEWELGKRNADVSATMLYYGLCMMYCLADAYADKSHAASTRRQVMRVCCAHHLAGLHNPVYRGVEHSDWPYKPKLLHVGYGRIYELMLKLGVDMTQSVRDVIQRTTRHVNAMEIVPITGNGQQRFKNYLVSEILTPRYHKEMRRVRDELLAIGNKYGSVDGDKLYMRICTWATNFLTYWTADGTLSSGMAESTFCGAYLGLVREYKTSIGEEERNELLNWCMSKIALDTDIRRKTRMEKLYTTHIDTRGYRNACVGIQCSSEEYYRVRWIDGAWELASEGVSMYGVDERAIDPSEHKLLIDLFNGLTKRNRCLGLDYSEGDEGGEHISCSTCVGIATFKKVCEHGLSIGVNSCSYWGAMLYCGSGICDADHVICRRA